MRRYPCHIIGGIKILREFSMVVYNILFGRQGIHRERRSRYGKPSRRVIGSHRGKLMFDGLDAVVQSTIRRATLR
jgi:hypothetical protein